VAVFGRRIPFLNSEPQELIDPETMKANEAVAEVVESLYRRK
jgi:hypothetical protein